MQDPPRAQAEAEFVCNRKMVLKAEMVKKKINKNKKNPRT